MHYSDYPYRKSGTGLRGFGVTGTGAIYESPVQGSKALLKPRSNKNYKERLNNVFR